MVLTITVVGNGQNGGHQQDGHAVLSPNELAQLMSGQTMTGLLNPDGSITLNSNMVPAQQMTNVTSMTTGMPITSSASMPQYVPSRMQMNQMQVAPSSNSIVNMPSTGPNDSSLTLEQPFGMNNHSQPTISPSVAPSGGQKKTSQKRLTAKQKAALEQQQQQHNQQQQQQIQNQHQHQQQQQQQQQQHHQQQQQIQLQQQHMPQHLQSQQMGHLQAADASHMMNAQPTSQSAINQQPQVVATIQLPNGQVGQLIAPSGGQFWTPNAINLQQLSMAVAAATGTMPQTLTLPAGTTQMQPHHNSQSQHMINQNSLQQPGQMHLSSLQQQQQHTGTPDTMSPNNNNNSSNSGNNNNGNTNSDNQITTAMTIPQNGSISMASRPGVPGQIWSGGAISLSQLSALAQQGVVQLAPVQGMPASSRSISGQRMMEVIPQAAIQGILNPGQPMTPGMSMAVGNGCTLINQGSDEASKWPTMISTSAATTDQSCMLQSTSGIQTRPTSSIGLLQSNIGLQSNASSSMQYSGSNNTSTTINNTAATMNHQSGKSSETTDTNPKAQPRRKLKRLACTCPNCRDGDHRSHGDKKKQHICHFPDCKKVYGKTSHLRAHLRWHSGERPYVCSWSFCGKKFTRSDELQRHRRTHTGEKRFQCPECLKKFMRSDHLSKHLKTHLATKKSSAAGQQQQQLEPTESGTQLQGQTQEQTQPIIMPNVVRISQDDSALHVKSEQNMIDGMNSQDDSSAKIVGSNVHLKYRTSC